MAPNKAGYSHAQNRCSFEELEQATSPWSIEALQFRGGSGLLQGFIAVQGLGLVAHGQQHVRLLLRPIVPKRKPSKYGKVLLPTLPTKPETLN